MMRQLISVLALAQTLLPLPVSASRRASAERDMAGDVMVQERLIKHGEKVMWQDPQVNEENRLAAHYQMPAVHCSLKMTYEMMSDGSLRVTEDLITDSTRRAPNMFRFGMVLEIPREYDRVEYYGRGPWENYVNRCASAQLGIYRQTVEEQFHPYVRAQDTGSKCDVRWWRVLNAGGCGLEFCAEQPFYASSLHYTVEQLDGGEDKGNVHPADLQPQPFTQVCIDGAQMGLECIDSWSAQPSPEFQLPCQNRTFTFIMRPCQ